MRTARPLWCALTFALVPFPTAAEDFTNAIHAFLQQRVEVEKRAVGIVVGIVDEHGSRVVSCGKLDNGIEQDVNGDTLFDIASITKPFTGLLLQDMIERGEMKLDDSAQKYLPASVRTPIRHGKEITLRHLATHTSGLPHFAPNLQPKRVDQPFADYTVEELNSFLSGYQLSRDPGTKFEYSSLGAGLLGHVIALKAGTDYESLLVNRICRPLKMDSTRITLTPELKSRFATGHNRNGEAVPSWDRQTQLGGSALRSTANDLLKFLSANLGLTPSHLTPVMEKTHAAHLRRLMGDMGLAWEVTRDPQGSVIVWHAGGAPGYTAVAGLDKTRRRGVVVLSSSDDVDVIAIGMLLLQSEWRADKRPRETKINSQVSDLCVGQYQLSLDFALGMFSLRLLFRFAPRVAIYIPAALVLALLFILLWRAATARKRWIILGCAGLIGGLLVSFVALAASYMICAHLQPVVGVRREGGRMFVQSDLQLSPFAVKFLPRNGAKLLPRITGELLAESETRLFERMTGMPVVFSRGDHGRMTRLTAHIFGCTFSHKKISDQPPKAYAPPRPRVPVRLDTEHLDVCVGDYQFESDTAPTGIKVTIWREGDQLLWRARGENVIPGAFNIYPESETNFFLKVTGAQLTFIRNRQGGVAAFTLRDDIWLPDGTALKIK